MTAVGPSSSIEFGEGCYITESITSDENTSIVAVSENDFCHVSWITESNGKLVTSYNMHNAHHGSITTIIKPPSSNGSVIITAARDGLAKVFDIRQGDRAVHSLYVPAYSEKAVRDADVYDAALNQREVMLAVGDRNGVCSFDLRKPGKPILQLQHHSDIVNCVEFANTAGGSRIVTSCDEGLVNVVDVDYALNLNPDEDEQTYALSTIKLASGSAKKLCVVEEFGVVGALKFAGGIELWKMDGLHRDDLLDPLESVDDRLNKSLANNSFATSMLMSDELSIVNSAIWGHVEDACSLPQALCMDYDKSTEKMVVAYNRGSSIGLFEVLMDRINEISLLHTCTNINNAVMSMSINQKYSTCIAGTDTGEMLLWKL